MHSAGGTVLERKEVSPTERQWQRFWTTVERIGVWSWADGYRGADEHERWLLELARADRRISTGGMGAYPPVSAATPSPEFLRLCAAVEKLVGGIFLPPR